ncbi:hypothetical protein B0J12DRAFT_750702 [Macrophomina phaseolina]|uniref:Uncharacterized protein n=1 Tax=Macrophomina phaseolina TaxID=35725 RepID=A0ABQ8GE63_9PEZI|nr:hypothetical protein B0J12DRAFT_750702 [Macrophomina phaseolina]
MPPLRIIKWEDFNYATLHKMYDHLLSDESINPRHFQIGPSFRRAKNEAGVGDFIQEYNLKVMVEALRETGHLLGRQEFISMARGHSAQLVRRDDGGRNYIPDWAGIRVHGHSFEPTEENPANILPGETKISRAWMLDESQIIENVGERGPYDWPDWFKPFVQIFSYCVELQVRYGYLITDKELVVVRIGPLDRSKRRRKSGRLSDEAERPIDLQRAAATLGHVPSEELRETLNNGVLDVTMLA